MAKWIEYLLKKKPADEDMLMLEDAESHNNKRVSFSGIADWLIEKMKKNNLISGALRFKGSSSYAALPGKGAAENDYYYCSDGDGTHGPGYYAWNGSSWIWIGSNDKGIDSTLQVEGAAAESAATGAAIASLKEDLSQLFEEGQGNINPIKTFTNKACYIVTDQNKFYYRDSSYTVVSVFKLEANKKYTITGNALTSILDVWAICNDYFEPPVSGYGSGAIYTQYKQASNTGTLTDELIPNSDCYLYLQNYVKTTPIDKAVLTNMPVPKTDKLDARISDMENIDIPSKQIAYKVLDNGIILSEKYDGENDIQYYLCKHSLNELFDFLHTYIYPNSKSNPIIHEIDNNYRIIYGNGDWHAPIQIKAINNADGDNLNPNDAYFTGGMHGYKNATTDASKTARCAGVRFFSDRSEIFANDVGYADEVVIYWENYLQASNTEKEDGSGREVLKECHTLTYINGEFHSHVELIPLEDITCVLWYGFQMMYQSGSNKTVRYIGATNRNAYEYNVNSECGDKTTDLFRLINNDTNMVQEMYVNPIIDVGKRNMCKSDLTKAMFGMNYGKAYATVINNNATLYMGCVYALDGVYRTYKQHTI